MRDHDRGTDPMHAPLFISAQQRTIVLIVRGTVGDIRANGAGLRRTSNASPAVADVVRSGLGGTEPLRQLLDGAGDYSNGTEGQKGQRTVDGRFERTTGCKSVVAENRRQTAPKSVRLEGVSQSPF